MLEPCLAFDGWHGPLARLLKKEGLRPTGGWYRRIRKIRKAVVTRAFLDRGVAGAKTKGSTIEERSPERTFGGRPASHRSQARIAKQ